MQERNEIKESFETEIKKIVKKYCKMDKADNFICDKENRVIVKENYIKNFLREIHQISGHRGMTTMYNNLFKFYFIKNITKSIKDVVNKCKICGKYKKSNLRIQKCNLIAEKPFERISTDIFGPFNLENYLSSERKKVGYILTITDIYSRLTKLKFLYKIDSASVIDGIEEWISTHKKPKVIISDNGRQYISNEIEDYLLDQDIKHILVPIYTPSSNGISESINKTISFMLSINKGETIHKTITMIETVINYNYNRSIKSSPMAVIQGINSYDPVARILEFKNPFSENIIYKVNVGDYCRERNYMAKKLDHKYSNRKRIEEVSRRGYWVKLQGNKRWTHLKNLKF